LAALPFLPLLHSAENATLRPPAQDQGLPYTRSARAAALAKIKDHIAVCSGSRYAYVKGFKVRLDESRLLGGEACLSEGRLLVPASFAGVLGLGEIRPPAAPAYLADRWVSTLGLPRVDGAPVALAELAAKKGLKVLQLPSGLLLIGEREISFSSAEATLLESVVTLFDTPEKFADPALATKYIPTLARQGAWTDHVKATPEQLALLKGPETPWPTVPKAAYDFSGFNAALLGSKVPAPGVYPRILFSPEDLPLLAARINNSKTGQMALIEMEHLFRKSWWDPSTSDGKLFLQLAKGDVKSLQWDAPAGSPPGNFPQIKGHKPVIHNSHVAYIPECLTSMSLYCLLTGDDAHGRLAAAAIATYYRMREPQLDELNALSDSEFGSLHTRADGTRVAENGSGAETHWRTVSGLVAHMNLGLALDFSGKWMSAADKDSMRRFIAKATYGKRAYGQDAPVRFRDVNWVTWDLPHYLALLAIEGLEGFDAEADAANRETVRAFCDWGIDDSGVVYESNGKTPGGLQFQFLSMVALARRGENLFGHPHFRKFLRAQVLMTSPSGRVTVNSGTQYQPFSQQFLGFQFTDEHKAFFPAEREADYLLGRARQLLPLDEAWREWIIDGFDPAEYRGLVAKVPRLRLPSPTYPGFVHGVIYDTDFAPTTRAELGLPLDFSAPVHGVFSSYSDASPDAAWVNLMVRPNHYLGAGHHHADAGMLHFSALGVDWFTQSPYHQAYDGKYFNLVQVDGVSEATNMPGLANGYNAPAKYLGMTTGPGGAAATADLTYAYSYRWLTQPAPVWSEAAKRYGWELDPSPEVLGIFAGTARYKLRPWWANYTYSNYIPTCRAPFNPMQYVFRTAALVRGEHPYAVVLDDLRKDAAPHLYQWAAMLNGGVREAELKGLPAGQLVLAFRAPKAKAQDDARWKIKPSPGEPLLLVCTADSLDSGDPARPLIELISEDGPPDRQGKPQPPYDRLVINHRGVEAAYRVLLIPFRAGEALPQVRFDKKTATARIRLGSQIDDLRFPRGGDQRSGLMITRGAAEVITVK
jgi:hypothetical protein